MTPNRARVSLYQLALAFVLLIIGLTGAWLLLTGKPKPESVAPEASRAPLVSVVIAEPQTTTLSVRTQGTVEPRRRISLIAQVGGVVESVAPDFLNGAFFEAGEPLLQIEQSDYEFALARARAQLAAAEQSLAEERGRNYQARREWRDLGSEEANDLFLRKPQMHAAEQSLAAARADVDAAKLALARTQITAPFAGRVEAKRIDVGQYVAAGSVLADVYATDVMEVRLPLTDGQLALLDIPLHNDDRPRSVTLSARLGDQTWKWEGLIRRTEASLDRSSRVMYAIADVEQPFVPRVPGQPPLLPGLFVRADIATRNLEGLVALPDSALRADGTVLVVSERGQLQRREVSVRQRSGDRVWVRGLSAGERLVADQTATLASGMVVDVSASVLAGE